MGVESYGYFHRRIGSIGNGCEDDFGFNFNHKMNQLHLKSVDDFNCVLFIIYEILKWIACIVRSSKAPKCKRWIDFRIIVKLIPKPEDRKRIIFDVKFHCLVFLNKELCKGKHDAREEGKSGVKIWCLIKTSSYGEGAKHDVIFLGKT